MIHDRSTAMVEENISSTDLFHLSYVVISTGILLPAQAAREDADDVNRALMWMRTEECTPEIGQLTTLDDGGTGWQQL